MMYECPECKLLVCDARRGWARSRWKQPLYWCPSCGSKLIKKETKNEKRIENRLDDHRIHNNRKH